VPTTPFVKIDIHSVRCLWPHILFYHTRRRHGVSDQRPLVPRDAVMLALHRRTATAVSHTRQYCSS